MRLGSRFPTSHRSKKTRCECFEHFMQSMESSTMNHHILAMFGLPGGVEWVVILLAALLLFGRRLPDVARSVGKSIVEFKRGLRDVKDDIDTASKLDADKSHKLDSNSDKPANHSAGD